MLVSTSLFATMYNMKFSGFKESLKTSCGYGGKLNYDKDVVCGKTKKVNGREVLVAKACKDP